VHVFVPAGQLHSQRANGTFRSQNGTQSPQAHEVEPSQQINPIWVSLSLNCGQHVSFRPQQVSSKHGHDSAPRRPPSP
jgi:hypothetical protein